MINLKIYSGTSRAFLDNVIKSKRDPNYKTRITALKPVITPMYDSYDKEFKRKTLVNLSPHGFDEISTSDLLKLYSYKGKHFVNLRKEVTTVLDNRALTTCQNCTIGEVSSLDHFLPKEEFPEFAVHPYNLIPSCGKCNGHKSTIWKNDDKTLFINLYTDILPKEQYLFVKRIDLSDDNVDVTFEVRNDNNIDADTFNLIKNHHDKLKLCERFTLDSHKIITEFIHTIENYPKSCSTADIIESVINTINENKKSFGYNHYAWILKEALICDQPFLDKYLYS